MWKWNRLLLLLLIYIHLVVGEGNGTPLQYSCLENPMDGGAWWAAVHGVAESDTTEWLHFQFSLSPIGEGNGNPLQCSCLENPRDRGAWWAAVHGVAMSWTRLSDFTFTFHFHALEREMAIPSSILAWRIPGTGEPGGLPSMGSHRVGHDWSDLAAAADFRGRRNCFQECGESGKVLWRRLHFSKYLILYSLVSYSKDDINILTHRVVIRVEQNNSKDCLAHGLSFHVAHKVYDYIRSIVNWDQIQGFWSHVGLGSSPVWYGCGHLISLSFRFLMRKMEVNDGPTSYLGGLHEWTLATQCLEKSKFSEIVSCDYLLNWTVWDT